MLAPLNGSGWSLRRVLALIEKKRCEHALRFFLAHLDPPELLREALAALREVDFDTGLVRDMWSCAESLQLEQDTRAGRPVLPDMPSVWPLVPPAQAPPPRAAPDPVDD